MFELARRGWTAASDPVEIPPPARGLSVLWPVGLIAAVLYGSLLPFDIDWHTLQPSKGLGMLRVGLRSASLEDILTNVLLYVPIGCALAVYARRWLRPRLLRVALVVTVGAFVSLFAETLQSGIATRVASWTDVTLNAFGAALGATVGVVVHDHAAAIVGRLRPALRDRPFESLASVLTIGLFLYGLAPFDFVLGTDELHAAFRRAATDFSLPRAIVANHESYSRMTGPLIGAAWFAVLGYLLSLAAHRSGRDSIQAIGFAMKQGFVLAGLIEVMQLFTTSHRFDPTMIVVGWLAVTMGAWCASLIVERLPRKRWQRRPWLAVPTLLLASLVALQACVIVISSVVPDIFSLQASDAMRVRWVPFEALWHRPMGFAMCEVVSKLVIYGTLALTLVLTLRRGHVAAVWLIAGAAVVSLAMATEAVRACTATGSGDLTEPILSLVAVLGVARLYATLRPPAEPVSVTPASPTRPISPQLARTPYVS